MSYTLEQRLEYARGQAINNQDKEAIQLAIDRIKELEADCRFYRSCALSGEILEPESQPSAQRNKQ